MRSPTGSTTKSPRAVTVPACQWRPWVHAWVSNGRYILLLRTAIRWASSAENVAGLPAASEARLDGERPCRACQAHRPAGMSAGYPRSPIALFSCKPPSGLFLVGWQSVALVLPGPAELPGPAVGTDRWDAAQAGSGRPACHLPRLRQGNSVPPCKDVPPSPFKKGIYYRKAAGRGS